MLYRNSPATWNAIKLTTHAVASWKQIIPAVSFVLPTSLRIVAIVAVHGTYRRQKTMSEYAFAAPNPIAPSTATKLPIP